MLEKVHIQLIRLRREVVVFGIYELVHWHPHRCLD